MTVVVDVELVDTRFRWLIQSPSATGLRTGFEGTWFIGFWPVEEVRGGIALGERGLSDTIGDVSFGESLLENIECDTNLLFSKRMNFKISQLPSTMLSIQSRCGVAAQSFPASSVGLGNMWCGFRGIKSQQQIRELSDATYMRTFRVYEDSH